MRHALAQCSERVVVLACRCYAGEACVGRRRHTLVALVAKDFGAVLKVHAGSCCPSASTAGSTAFEQQRGCSARPAWVCYGESVNELKNLIGLVTDTYRR